MYDLCVDLFLEKCNIVQMCYMVICCSSDNWSDFIVSLLRVHSVLMFSWKSHYVVCLRVTMYYSHFSTNNHHIFDFWNDFTALPSMVIVSFSLLSDRGHVVWSAE